MDRWSTSLTERPILEHEGRRYQRQAGTWIDAATHMKVAVNLSRQLDGLAKLNSSLWDDCHLQDFNDNPKNR